MIVISGTIEFDAANTDAMIAATDELVAATTQEAGCVSYGFWFHPGQPGVARVIEEWADDDALNAHMGADHMMAFLGAAGGFGISSTSINRYDVSAVTKFM